MKRHVFCEKGAVEITPTPITHSKTHCLTCICDIVLHNTIPFGNVKSAPGAGSAVLQALLSTPPADPTLMNEPEPWYVSFAGDWWKEARWYCRAPTSKFDNSDHVFFICEVNSANSGTSGTSSFWLEFESLEKCPEFLVAFRVHEFGRCAFREAVWTSLRRQSLFSSDPDDGTELFVRPTALRQSAGEMRPLMSHPRSVVLRSAAGSYLPQRFLRGFLPEVLLQDHFHFWQISENCIDGRREQIRDKQRLTGYVTVKFCQGSQANTANIVECFSANNPWSKEV